MLLIPASGARGRWISELQASKEPEVVWPLIVIPPCVLPSESTSMNAEQEMVCEGGFFICTIILIGCILGF